MLISEQSKDWCCLQIFTTEEQIYKTHSVHRIQLCGLSELLEIKLKFFVEVHED